MAVRIGEQLQAFAAEKIPAILGTVRRDGSAQMNPVWFEYDDGYFWINGGPQRGWLRHIRRDPKQRVTLLLIDPKSMWRWAQIQGRVVDVTEEGAWEHIDRLSRRYLGQEYMRRPGDKRLKVKIEPLRVTGGDNRVPWD
ncbi:MAG: PPOX class F420-dependent oxidoreductase [Chloroflexi bacterium]|nr:MAG: PPOX class F420-dependent oxidoreductase [Chloroflexota bacterium]